ncbi:Nickel uptake substrate-specific transmembrane region [Falsiruegeria litorea R37]|uniref:Nickel uptake substrate-specific transmembrane region n=2 Tax=Falsiruegeria litorea TaxID=1280831 RepID=A0A1Y5SDW7_9RHOB|nr:Nickel uptake substrate-specific transmembrane region [Falsiruegeria litorea R37]
MANLVIGQRFEGSPQMFFDTRIARFELHQGGQVAPYAGRMGDIPALETVIKDPGLLVIVHQTQPSTLKYHEWSKFQAFVDEKGFGDVLSRHLERGLPRDGFYESYTRHAKALIAVGSGSGTDHVTGMEVEFIAGVNPYVDDLSQGLPVQLLYQGQPLAETQITIIERAPTGDVHVKTLQSDDRGQALIRTRPGHTYLLDAVVLRPAPKNSEAVWDTLWAALTFFVPER